MSSPVKNASASAELSSDDITDITPKNYSNAKPPKLTKNEGHVYDVLRTTGNPMKAYRVLQHVQNAHGIKAPMTVYRALKGLSAKGLVKKINKTSTYVAVNPTAAASSILVCPECGKVHLRSLSREQVVGLFGTADIPPEKIYIEAHKACANGACRA